MSHGRGRPHKKQKDKTLQESPHREANAHYGNAETHKAQSHDLVPTTPANIKKNVSDHSTHDPEADQTKVKRSVTLGMTVFEWLMSFLTLAGVLVAALTGAIFLNQLYTTITDQRAWIIITNGPITTQKTAAGITLTTNITLNNTGKTPASKMSTNVVIAVVQNGSAPTFKYDFVPRTTDSAGALFPDSSLKFDAYLLHESNAGQVETRYLSAPEYAELTGGTAYVAIYGLSLYDDVYNVRRWTRFCVFAALTPGRVNVTAKACTDYNAADNNQPSLAYRIARGILQTVYTRV